MSRVLYILIAILVALLGLVFHVRNHQPVVLDYVAGTVEVDLSWVVVGALVVGALLGALGMTASWLGVRREVRRLARRSARAEREAASLRALASRDAG